MVSVTSKRPNVYPVIGERQSQGGDEGDRPQARPPLTSRTGEPGRSVSVTEFDQTANAESKCAGLHFRKKRACRHCRNFTVRHHFPILTRADARSSAVEIIIACGKFVSDGL